MSAPFPRYSMYRVYGYSIQWFGDLYPPRTAPYVFHAYSTAAVMSFVCSLIQTISIFNRWCNFGNKNYDGHLYFVLVYCMNGPTDIRKD
jgi:hypothetical protein